MLRLSVASPYRVAPDRSLDAAQDATSGQVRSLSGLSFFWLADATCEASCPADKAYKCYKKPDKDEDEDEVADRDGGDGACEDDSGWEKHPAKKGKTLDCDWVAKSPKKRCKKKNKGGTKASKACACACA